MTINEAYIKYIILVNRNATNNNIGTDYARFILNFNSTTNMYVEWVLEKRNEDDIRDIQKILVKDKKLEKTSTGGNSSEDFILPKDYFNFANLSIFATKDKCKEKRLVTFEVKSEDVEELIADESNRPTFEWRETFYYLNSGNVSVYKNDFQIDKALMTYYRYPRKVDIEGYENVDGGASTNIDPEFDDKVVDRILLAMSKNFSANNMDINGYQANKDRLFSEL